jgi:hypothetical protein
MVLLVGMEAISSEAGTLGGYKMASNISAFPLPSFLASEH